MLTWIEPCAQSMASPEPAIEIGRRRATRASTAFRSPEPATRRMCTDVGLARRRARRRCRRCETVQVVRGERLDADVARAGDRDLEVLGLERGRADVARARRWTGRRWSSRESVRHHVGHVGPRMNQEWFLFRILRLAVLDDGLDFGERRRRRRPGSGFRRRPARAPPGWGPRARRRGIRTRRASRGAAAAAAIAMQASIRATGAAMRVRWVSCSSLLGVTTPVGCAHGLRRIRAMPRSRRISSATSSARSTRRLAHRHVAHLAPGPRLALAVEVQVRAGMAQHRFPARLAVAPDVAQQVHHHRRACAAKDRPAAGRTARAPAARTARCGRRRSCSGRCCAGAARSRSRSSRPPTTKISTASTPT